MWISTWPSILFLRKAPWELQVRYHITSHCTCQNQPKYLITSDGRFSAAHPVGSGVMLLGGFGFLSRLYGLSIDALVEVEMVLSDGTIAIVNEKENTGMVIRVLKHS
jgi:hypothetical protein